MGLESRWPNPEIVFFLRYLFAPPWSTYTARFVHHPRWPSRPADIFMMALGASLHWPTHSGHVGTRPIVTVTWIPKWCIALHQDIRTWKKTEILGIRSEGIHQIFTWIFYLQCIKRFIIFFNRTVYRWRTLNLLKKFSHLIDTFCFGLNNMHSRYSQVF